MFVDLNIRLDFAKVERQRGNERIPFANKAVFCGLPRYLFKKHEGKNLTVDVFQAVLDAGFSERCFQISVVYSFLPGGENVTH